jgi:DNA helicase-2/ATP-dependent DNA helicase PcrA
LIDAEDDEDEAERIVAAIRGLRFRERADWEDIGILVRTNSLAEGIEEKLVEHNVPYRVAGGPSFYQRREVKDIVAYLKAAVNPDDDVSVLRVLNVPRRGVGPATVEFLSNIARDRVVSLRRAVEMTRQSGFVQIKDGHLQRALREVYAFFDYLAQLRMALLEQKRPVSAAIRTIVDDVGYWQYLLEEYKKSDKVAAWKYRNIELLAASAERWEKDPDTFEKDIFAYLARISLTVRDDAGDGEQRLSLLTIHAAKGLEFDYVFIPGCENGILPHARSLEESGDIEEERRLFYVAVTRAKRQLFISRAMRRKKSGAFQETAASPFLDELPKDLIVMADDQAQPRDEAELRREFFSRLKSRLGA